MKSTTKKTIIIAAPIVAVLVIAIVALSLITINPYKQFDGYQSLYVMNNPVTMQNDFNAGEVENGLPTLKFSIMRGMLEGNLNYKIKPVKVTNSNGDEVYKTIAAKDFVGLKPALGKYMICFDFGSGAAKTNKYFKDQDGKLIIYDRIIMVIETPNSDIQSVKLYPHIFDNLDNGSLEYEPNDKGEMGSIYYNVYEFTAKMYTTRLYEILQEADFTAGGASDNMS